MKSNTLKKVLSIAIISIILAIVVATCVLAFVQKTLYNPATDLSDSMDNYYLLTIYKDGYTSVYHNRDENEDEGKKQTIADIAKLTKESTKASILSLMFQGTGSFEPEITTTNAGDVKESIAKASGQVCLVYDFTDEEQTLMWNGEAYKNDQANDPDKPVKFSKIFIPVSNTSEFDVVTAYLTGIDNKSSYQVKFLAHQSELYQYLTNITWEYTVNKDS